MTIVASGGFVLNGSGVDGDTSGLLFWSSIDIVIILEFSLTYS
jgi:hypothetical protein